MSKLRKISIICLSLIFALACITLVGCGKTEDEGGAGTGDNPFEEFDMYINASDLETADIVETKEVGDFIIQASSTGRVSVDSNAKSPIDLTAGFTKRIKLNGVSNLSTLDRTISFYLDKKATIKVYAMSSSSTDPTRTLKLYKSGTPTALDERYVEASGSTLEPLEFKTTEAGSYYFTAEVNAVNIYFVGVTYTGEATPVQRADWSTVSAPTLTTATVGGEGKQIIVGYQGNIGTDGADKLRVNMLNSANEVVAKTTVIRYSNAGTVSFTPTASGVYHFEAQLERTGETEVKKTASALNSEYFNLVLSAPTVRGRTGANGTMVVTTTEVKEADKYVLEYKKSTETAWQSKDLTATGNGEITTELSGFAVGETVNLKVTATRTSTGDSVVSSQANAIVRNAEEYDWQFAAFGQSTKSGSLNSIHARKYNNIFDGVQLYSAEYDSTGYATSKGGKFTYGSHDGISYYYTKIDASEEDFRIKARVVVDYINPTPDGQEGFALLVRDSIGVDGDTAYYYTNSAAAIATKIQYDVGATRKTITDGLGSRFVTGVKSTTETPEAGSFVQKMYPHSQEPVYKTVNPETDGYILEIEKVNNCYYSRYYQKDFATGQDVLVSEHALYHDGSINNGQDGKDQLLMIDEEYVYVGFAVARGCNATFKDIEFEKTPRSTKTVTIENEKIVADYKVTSATTSSIPEYDFNFLANADGKLTVTHNGKVIIKNAKIKSMVDYVKTIKLTEEINEFVATFTPNADYKPGQYQEMESYEAQDIIFNMTYRKYGDASTPIYAAPSQIGGGAVVGSAANEGTKDSPLDLQTALNYCLPGQTVYLMEGTYEITSGNITIERGNDGTRDNRKYLKPDPDAKSRPVLDYMNKGGGLTVWGSYWHLSGFDLTKTAFGKKGIQLGGKYNILENVNTYYNGDSGISVSGKSTESWDKWPAYNLILNCTSYMNKDQAEEDADGFAAKLYCADGNVFRGCIAYCNADDGWDLYAKTESGTIGAVTIENCLTFGNGFNIDGTPTKGNGNGFKMGGESLPGKHKITNSVSFGNKLKGIDSNSCPDDIMIDCTSVYNGNYNYAFYSTKKTSFEVKNCISLMGGKSDQIAGQKTNPIKNETNYFFVKIEDSASTSNTAETPVTIDMSIFKDWNNDVMAYFGFELDQENKEIKQGNFNYIIDKVTKTRRQDGTIDTKGFLELKDSTMEAGANIYDFSGVDGDLYAMDYPSESGCNKGCKSEVNVADFVLGFAILSIFLVVLLKKQRNNG